MTLLRYLSRDILFHTGAISVILLLIIFSGRLAKYLAEAAVGDIPGEVLLPLMFYRVPGFMELILPLGLFLGILMSYGRLYVNSEMIILFASGIGRSKLALYTSVPTVFVGLIVAAFSLLFTPVGVEKSLGLLEGPELSRRINALVPGRFQVKNDLGATSYTEFVDEENVMYGVFLIQSDGQLDTSTITITTAEQGEIKADLVTGDRYIELRNGGRYKGLPGRLDYDVTHFERFGELLPSSDREMREVSLVDSRSTRELFYSDQAEDKAALQWRISLPVTVFVLAFIALSLSKTNSRKGRFLNLLPAFLIYVAYILCLGAVRGQLETDSYFLPGGMWTVHVFFLVIAIVLFLGRDYILEFGKALVKA